MLRYAIDFRFRRHHPDLSLEPLASLEVGLDCLRCGKVLRTVEAIEEPVIRRLEDKVS